MIIILRWFLNALILLLIANITPGVSFSGFGSALVAALIIGLLNALIKPILILLTLPINIVTFGLFTLIINGFIFWLAGTVVVKGFEVQNFTAAIIAALLYWLATTLISFFVDRPRQKIIRPK